MSLIASPDAVLNDVLLADGPTAALVGTRVWGGVLYPPAGSDYKPNAGPAICHQVVTGEDDYTDLLQHSLIQLKCYAKTEADADVLVRTVHNALHGFSSNKIKWARRANLPQILTEPDTNWIFAFVSYNVMVIN